MNAQRLTELFRIIGAQDPQARARLQLEKGIAHLPRDLFWFLAVGEATHPSDRDWLTT